MFEHLLYFIVGLLMGGATEHFRNKGDKKIKKEETKIKTAAIDGEDEGDSDDIHPPVPPIRP